MKILKAVMFIFFLISSISCRDGGEVTRYNNVINVSNGIGNLSSIIESAENFTAIIVDGGEYAGNINIVDKEVYLIGVNQPKINCNNDGTNGLNIFNADSSSIKGFTIENCEDGISTDSVIVISGNKFFKNVDGIDFEGGGGGVFGNRFDFNIDDGVDLDGDVNVEIVNNVISNNADDGIEIRLHPKDQVLKSKIIIEYNEIENNAEVGIQLIDYGILTGRIFYISRNKFEGNRLAQLSVMNNGNTIEDKSGGTLSDVAFIYNNNFIGGEMGVSASGETIILENNIVYGSAVYFSDSLLNPSVTNILWGNGGDDPIFNIDEYKISLNSELIDAGVSVLNYQTESVVIKFEGFGVDIGQHEVK
jgi:hypothetical protein